MTYLCLFKLCALLIFFFSSFQTYYICKIQSNSFLFFFWVTQCIVRIVKISSRINNLEWGIYEWQCLLSLITRGRASLYYFNVTIIPSDLIGDISRDVVLAKKKSYRCENVTWKRRLQTHLLILYRYRSIFCEYAHRCVHTHTYVNSKEQIIHNKYDNNMHFRLYG